MKFIETIILYIYNPKILQLVLERKLIELKSALRIIDRQEAIEQYNKLKEKWGKI